METRLLKMFCAVAETGGLVTAGRKLHLTPSALSHSLKALETDLGCRLFERVGKRMVLNQAGEQLLAQVRGPLAALESAANGIKRLAKWGQTRLRIGASASAEVSAASFGFEESDADESVVSTSLVGEESAPLVASSRAPPASDDPHAASAHANGRNHASGRTATS